MSSSLELYFLKHVSCHLFRSFFHSTLFPRLNFYCKIDKEEEMLRKVHNINVQYEKLFEDKDFQKLNLFTGKLTTCCKSESSTVQFKAFTLGAIIAFPWGVYECHCFGAGFLAAFGRKLSQWHDTALLCSAVTAVSHTERTTQFL